MLRVNVTGSFVTAKYAVNLMVERHDRGSIVLVSNILR